MLPTHAPFPPEQARSLDLLLAGFSPAQRDWLAGYLSAQAVSAPIGAATSRLRSLTLLYGTESGNAEQLAADSAKVAKKRGFKVSVKSMADISPKELVNLENLLLIVSTWGEGDPPESAVGFYQELMTGVRDLPQLRFSVCGLGDSSYQQFCQIGKDIDERLAGQGGERIAPRVDCDVDFEDAHREWLEAALTGFGSEELEEAVAEVADPVVTDYGRKNPFSAEMLEKVELSGEGSLKETWHYELSLEGSGMFYQAGDALAVLPLNAPEVVDALLSAAKLTGREQVCLKGGAPKPLAEALREDLEITTLSRAVLKKLSVVVSSDSLQELLADGAKQELKDYLWGRWTCDALADFAHDGLSAQDLLGIFRKIPPRLYSIASSPLLHPGEVHLTVAALRYEGKGGSKKGVASTYLADWLGQGASLRVYTHANKNFRLPASDETPIIMVGVGTGVAPFRAFVEQRSETSAKGKSWLIFGEQRYIDDFLYQLEWQEHLESGALSRIDVAFSRDQPEKEQVQQRMLDHAGELFAWLEQGAHFYVAGDVSRMAPAVDETLLQIVEHQGGMSGEEAVAYVDALKKSKRYQRDVY